MELDNFDTHTHTHTHTHTKLIFADQNSVLLIIIWGMEFVLNNSPLGGTDSKDTIQLSLLSFPVDPMGENLLVVLHHANLPITSRSYIVKSIHYFLSFFFFFFFALKHGLWVLVRTA